MFIGAIVSVIVGFIQTFWMWLVGASIAVLAFLFSPTIRKYTIGVIAVGIILVSTFLWGYNSNHNVEVRAYKCSEFTKHLVTGPATDKAIRIFQRNKLCE